VKRLDLLRRIDPCALAAYERVRLWRSGGVVADFSVPTPDRSYLCFVAQGRQGPWRGLIDTQAWLHSVLPQLGNVLPKGCPDASVAALFQTVPQPVACAPAELQYDGIGTVELVEVVTTPMRSLPRLPTPQGSLWLLDPLPALPGDSQRLPDWLGGLPQTLDFHLGASQLLISQRARLTAGDLLPINDRQQRVCLAGRCISRFTLTEEGFHMEMIVPPNDLDVLAEPAGTQAPLAAPQTLAQLPVRLEFVLQQTTCSLSELATLLENKVVPLASAARHNVEVRANGTTVAVGELVQWDDQLGVELHTVYRGT